MGFYRGPKPDWIAITQMSNSPMGLKTIINLEIGIRELLIGDANDELNWCYNNGVRLFDLDWQGYFVPKDKDVSLALSILKNSSLRPIYLHCRHGRERTGFMVAVYRMQVEGWSLDAAYKEMKKMGCRWPFTWLWKRALKKWV